MSNGTNFPIFAIQSHPNEQPQKEENPKSQKADEYADRRATEGTTPFRHGDLHRGGPGHFGSNSRHICQG